MSGLPFLVPENLLWALLALPILLLYMLRLRRREKKVSSTLLWEKLLRDREANALWQRLRHNWLLFLQLLILAALVFALARPFLSTSAPAGGNIIVLLDGSASMLATDIAPNRFEQAREETSRLIDNLGRNEKMAIIKSGSSALIMSSPTNDKAELRQALAAAQPELGRADWQTAVSLANGLASGIQDPQIVIFSDGGLPDKLPAVGAEIIYVPLGQSAENLALSALSLREGDNGPVLFARVHNFGAGEQSALLNLKVDGRLYDARQIAIPAGEDKTLTWELAPDALAVEAYLTNQTADYLAVDDRGWAVRPQESDRRALLLSENNLFLEQVFRVLPDVQAFKTAPDGDFAAENYDLLIFDGVMPPSPAPDVAMLLINPPPGQPSELLSAGGTITGTTAVRLSDSPLLEFVNWDNVHIRQARQIAAPWAEAIIEGKDGPLLLAGEKEGRRIVIIPFDLLESDLPLQIAFPILMANITNWLNPAGLLDSSGSIQPDQPVVMKPRAGTTFLTITTPSGKIWEREVGKDEILYTETHEPGLYEITAVGLDGKRSMEQMAISFNAAEESTIQPDSHLKFGTREINSSTEEARGRREYWPWLLLLAIIGLAVEWWLHFYGWRLPGIRLT